MLMVGSSCNSENTFDCFKTTGVITELELFPGSFNRVEINDGLEIFLSNAPEESVRIKGGKNLIPKVRVELDSGQLRLYNENTCNWTRDYDPIQVYISAPSIDEILHYGYGNVYSLDTLKCDRLNVIFQWSAGNVDLTVDAKLIQYVSNSLSSTTISGNTNRLYVGDYYNDGIFNSENLNSKFVAIDHKGYGSIRVRGDSIYGSIERNGLLEYYSKSPTTGVDILDNGRIVYLGL